MHAREIIAGKLDEMADVRQRILARINSINGPPDSPELK
jgi:hypothetical protein